ncbi:MAG: ArsC family reductase [Rhizobacter sp.]|nr:ArsC family reductase [Rhizobacter sp.]
MTITLYGIANCDTVKKARTWLAEHHADVSWHDFKKQGVPEPQLDRWLKAVGWEKLVNRQGTTWRKMPDDDKAAVVDAASARALMLSHQSVIKRPVVEWPNGLVTVGFSEALFSQHLG